MDGWSHASSNNPVFIQWWHSKFLQKSLFWICLSIAPFSYVWFTTFKTSQDECHLNCLTYYFNLSIRSLFLYSWQFLFLHEGLQILYVIGIVRFYNGIPYQELAIPTRYFTNEGNRIAGIQLTYISNSWNSCDTPFWQFFKVSKIPIIDLYLRLGLYKGWPFQLGTVLNDEVLKGITSQNPHTHPLQFW